jgi:CheY-like chemotaxis protein
VVRGASDPEKLRTLGRMATGVAHDISQALALVSGYTEIARYAAMEGDSAGLAEALSVIQRAALDGGQTAQRLLTFWRGNSAREPHPVALGTLLREVVCLTAPCWRDQALADGRQIRLVLEISDEALIVSGYAESLREALINVVLNAVDALPKGGMIRLAVRAEKTTAVIEVKDSGVGMSDDVQVHAFEPFFTTKGTRGTGLGLALVKEIVNEHGGTVAVSSEPGIGTTFRIRLPISDGSGFTPRSTSVSATIIDSRLRVLVVEDHASLARMTQAMVEHQGHLVEVAVSAEQALAVAEQREFDVVISDLGLGNGMSGWDLAARLKARRPETHFVLATGWGAAIDAREARTGGIDYVLTKPYAGADLRRALRAGHVPRLSDQS